VPVSSQASLSVGSVKRTCGNTETPANSPRPIGDSKTTMLIRRTATFMGADDANAESSAAQPKTAVGHQARCRALQLDSLSGLHRVVPAFEQNLRATRRRQGSN